MNGYFIFLGKKKRTQKVAYTFLLSIVFQLLFPLHTFALTSGPSQEEYGSFEPFETNQMVDPYSGDFTYNLPLLSVPGPNGGYPVNLSYHSGITMDQEASWTGLGWNINVGAINRGLRGLPDDIKGLDIKQTAHIKDFYTTSLTLPYVKKKENYGMENGNGTVATQIYYNNYKGVGYRINYSYNFKGLSSSVANTSFGLSYDSQGGIGISPQISAGQQFCEVGYQVGLSANINSRNGLTSWGLSSGFSFKDTQDWTGKVDNTGNAVYQSYNINSSLSFPTQFYVPQVSMPMQGKRINFDFKFPIKFLGGATKIVPYTTKSLQFLWYQGSYEETKIANGGAITYPGYGYLYASNKTNAMNDFERKEITYSKKIPNISPTAFTYDVFSVSGQGVGGMFRPYRNDVGVLSDPETQSEIDLKPRNLEIGIDFGTGYVNLHNGFNIKFEGYDNTTKGPWSSGKQTIDEKFFYNDATIPNLVDRSLYEPSYFQMYGEKTALYDTENQLTAAGGNWGEDYPVRAKLFKKDKDFEVDAANNFIYNKNGGQINFTAPKSVVTSRKRRANNIEYLTTDQAKKFGLSSNYTYSVPGSTTPVSKYAGLSTDANDQLSEIVIRQTDGSRYVYGLPAHNNTHIDASFRADISHTHRPISPDIMCAASACNNANEKVRLVSTEFSYSTDPKTGGIPQAAQTTSGDILDEYVSKVQKPMYAHSWMMTHLLGSDYVDCDGVAGPSDGDYGYWVKFNYKKTAANYQWRFPFHDAAYSPNSISNPKDDMGTYSYGTKDVYYLESIETKTHKAIFYTSARLDGFEARGEFNSITNGYSSIRGTNTLSKLDSVGLYTKAALLSPNQADRVSLQTVNFTYNYALCQRVPNNSNITNDCNNTVNTGKLTLKEIYFTYSGSKRGQLSKYKFNYGEYKDASGNAAISNPNYDAFKVDRWGYYNPFQYGVPVPGSPYSITVKNIDSSNPDLNLSKLPYTGQTVPPDPYAWNLTSIETPTGGKIKVEYEPDDYLYVQDKPAMQMFNIRSVWKESLFPSASLDYTGICSNLSCSGPTSATSQLDPSILNGTNRCQIAGNSSVIFFDLEKPVLTNNTSEFANTYLKGISTDDKIYFKACMAVNKNVWTNRAFEDIGGYATIDLSSGNYGYAKSNPSLGYFDLGFIAIKNEKMGKNSSKYLHPFQQAAINYVRMNRPEYIYESGTTYSTSGFAIANIGSLFSFITDIAKNIQSFNKFAAKKGIGDVVKLSGHSMIRLGAPDEKYGGGIRVKRIYIEDNFKTPTANIYGQEYDYKVEENGVMVSSGVAYEPMVGGDENALRQAIPYTESSPLKSPVSLFLEEPLLEQFYPGPSVGYRKVTIKSIARSQAEAATLAATDRESVCEAQPSTIYEYYTPKDFPIYYDQTDLSADAPVRRNFPSIPGMPGTMKHILGRSQGYMIVINDMAGKLKSVTSIVPSKDVLGKMSYAQGKILHREVYNYKTSQPYNANGANRLDNNVVVLDETGCFKNARIGETSDIYIDANEEKNESKEFYLNMNLGVGVKYPPVAIIPIPIPLPKYSTSLIKYKSIVTMKIINRTGVLTSTEVYDGQAYNKKEHLVYSAATGEPVYSKMKNEFSEDVYNFSYPASVYYKNMAGAYPTFNAYVDLAGWGITSSINGSNQISLSDNSIIPGIFSVGDKLYLNNSITCHVLDKGVNGTTNYMRCIDANGNFIPNVAISSIRVIETAAKNMQSSYAGSVSTLKTMPYPITPGSSCVNTGYLITTDEQGCKSFVSPTIPNVLNASAVAYSDDWQAVGTTANMTTNQPYAPGVIGAAINPYYKAIKGIWHPAAQYSFMAKRKQNNYAKNDGTFDLVPFVWNNSQFADFMMNSSNPVTKCVKRLPGWYLNSVVTKISPYGYEIENMDADFIYSSAQYGYKNQLVKATAANAEYREMLFDGFEDYLDNYGYANINENHWQFNSVSNISSQFAHTGRYSLKIANGVTTPLEIKIPINQNTSATPASGYFPINSRFALATSGAVTTADSYNDIFSPKAGNNYEVSFWVKENQLTAGSYFSDVAYKNPNVLVEFYSNAGALIGTAVTANPYTQVGARIIEGWQRVIAPVNVPATAYFMKVKFVNQNLNTSTDTYFDDIRFYPAKGYLKSFVYDPMTLRYSATLDENNYATYYVYDNEGKLVITRKETKDGIKTISEGRTGSKQ